MAGNGSRVISHKRHVLSSAYPRSCHSNFFLGMQIVSCSGDGLLKLWTVKTSECVATFDAHDGKIWALDGKFFFLQ